MRQRKRRAVAWTSTYRDYSATGHDLHTAVLHALHAVCSTAEAPASAVLAKLRVVLTSWYWEERKSVEPTRRAFHGQFDLGRRPWAGESQGRGC